MVGLVLSGCGQPAEILVPTTDPPASRDGASSEADVVLLHATAAGGVVGDPVPVRTPAQLASFTGRLTSAPFVREVRRTVTAARSAAGAGQVVEAAVVALGCEVPDEVTLGPDGTVRVVTPSGGAERQCLAPMTTVAVFTVAR